MSGFPLIEDVKAAMCQCGLFGDDAPFLDGHLGLSYAKCPLEATLHNARVRVPLVA